MCLSANAIYRTVIVLLITVIAIGLVVYKWEKEQLLKQLELELEKERKIIQHQQEMIIRKEVDLKVAELNHTEKLEVIKHHAELEKQFHMEKELLKWTNDICKSHIDAQKTETSWNFGFYKRKKSKSSDKSLENCIEFAVKHLGMAITGNTRQEGIASEKVPQITREQDEL